MNIYERSNIAVPDGIIHNNVERLEELNERIHNRIIPDNNVKLNPVFDIRSVPTRNCLVFPVIDFKTTNKKLQEILNSFLLERFEYRKQDSISHFYRELFGYEFFH